MSGAPVRLPFAFVYQPGTAPAQAVQVGLQAMVAACFATTPVAIGPHERVMAMAALIGSEMSGVRHELREQAEAMVLAAMRGACRGTEDARFAVAEPAGRA
jgi:tRNA G18 (ribose-2'-O)-methylase SpoU